MKCLTALFFIIMMVIAPSFIFPGTGSEAEISKLKKELAALTGEKKADQLNRLSSKLVEKHPEQALEYANQGLDLSKKLKYRRGIAFALRAQGDALELLKRVDEARKPYEEALTIFLELKRDKDTATIYNKLGNLHRHKRKYGLALKNHRLALALYEKLGDKYNIAYSWYKIGHRLNNMNRHDESIAAFKRSLEIRKTLDDPKEVADVYSIIGSVCYNKNDFTTAGQYFRKALEVYRAGKMKRGVAKTLGHIGLIHDITGEFPQAIESHMESLKMYEELDNKKGMAGAYNNIGVIYVSMKKYQQGLEYYKKAVALEEKHGSPGNVAIMYNNIGIIHKNLEQYDEALKNYDKSLAIAGKIGMKRSEARTLGNIGIVHSNMKHQEKALEYYKKALKINRDINNDFGAAADLHNMGTAYIHLDQYQAAAKHLLKALELAKKHKTKELLRDCYDNLATLYSAQGKYKQAFNYYKTWVKTRDQIVNKDTNMRIAELKTKYETEKKEKEIALLKKDNEILVKNNEIQHLTISKQKFRTNAFIVGFILVCVIALLLLKKYLHLFAFWKKRNYIGHYKIIDQIGAGGMGVVYKATHVRRKSDPVAVKIIREEFSKDETQRKRFLNEALLVDQLNHPNIIEVYERGEYNDQLFIAMEMLDGPSLADIIKQGKLLPLDQCLQIMTQLTDTVARIHSKGIVHRDLKPDNILLIQKDGQTNFVKLLDFGLAFNQSLTRLTGTGEIVGTINYLPPEQISQRRYSPASDIYSLGVVFYELLTLHQPYIGELPVDIIKQILDKEPLPPRRYRSELPDGLSTLVMQMMEKEPECRPSEEFILNTLNHAGTAVKGGNAG